MDGASKSTLENEFGTSNEDECVKQILTKGQVQVSEVREDIRNTKTGTDKQNRMPSVAATVTKPWGPVKLIDCTACLKGSIT